ncbi:MAG TPA: thioredoxin domain-containing protein [Thermoanaerobaculia bacterium]|nr:thioredoxin domain-containing protein [Thermoanaerobaculia bacterium]
MGILTLAVALGGSPVRAEVRASEPLAVVNGEAITDKDIERTLWQKLSPLEEQIYSLKRQELENLIAMRLLAQEAKRRGISVAALLEAEVTARVAPVTEAEIELIYQVGKSTARGDETTVRQSIRTRLQQARIAERRANFVGLLREQSTVQVNLQPPPLVRAPVTVKGAPVRGAPEASVAVVEFSDYHCPFCKRVQSTLAQLLERFPGKVRLVYRDLPLDSLHPEARRAAEAARCAQDQGKFWEYHDLLFAQAPKATTEDLRRYGEQVGLDGATFDRCLSDRAHRTTVQRDLDEGKRLGVTGTPAFFVNGRPLVGAQPLEAFVRVIEDELARIAALKVSE